MAGEVVKAEAHAGEQLILRPATKAMMVGKASFTSPFRLAYGTWQLRQTLGIDERRNANPEHISAYAGTVTYAFEKYFAKYQNDQVHLVWVITHPDSRRRGAATKLCDWGQEEAKKRNWMWTVIARPMGKSLYEHFGCDLAGTETIRVPGEDENVVIYMMEEKARHATCNASSVAPTSTLASFGLGALYCIFGTK